MTFVNILFSINQVTRSKITPFLRLNHTHSLANDDFFFCAQKSKRNECYFEMKSKTKNHNKM